MRKRLYIFRGLPGMGKSTVAALIAMSHRGQGLAVAVLSADTNLINEKGEYEWSRERLSAAHAKVRRDFHNFISHSCGKSLLGNDCRDMLPLSHCDVLIIDNTNTTKKEYQHYKDEAIQNGWDVFEITVGDLNVQEAAKRNQHNVPIETLERMKARWEP